MPIRQFINSSIKRLPPSAPILLVAAGLVAGCGGSVVVPPPPPPAPLPAIAFVLTQSGAEQPYGFLSAVALPGGHLRWTATIPGQSAEGLVVAPRLGRAYVLAGPPFALTPVSLSTGAVGRPIRVGSAAWSAALAPDGTTAYVANAGDGVGGLPGVIGSTITPVNLQTGRADPAISVGEGPCGIAFAGDDTAYVSLAVSDHLAQVSLAAGRAGPRVAVPRAGIGQDVAPCAVAVSADAGLLAVGNIQQDVAFPAPVVDLLDLASHRWRRSITLPGASNAVDELGFSPDGRHVYVSARVPNGSTFTLYIASIATGRVTRASLTGQSVAFALTPDGGTLCVAVGTASGQTAVLPVNATTGQPGRAVAYLPGPPVAIGL